MNSEGGEALNQIEDKALEGLEKQFGESSKRECALDIIREDYAKAQEDRLPVGRMKTISNIISYLRAAKEDAPKNEQKGFEDKLRTTTDFIDQNVNTKELVEFFTEEQAHWQMESNVLRSQQEQETDNADAPISHELQIAERNVGILSSFIHTLENERIQANGEAPPNPGGDGGNPPDRPDSLEVEFAHEAHRQPTLPAFLPSLEQSGKYLEEVKGRITLGSLEGYLKEATGDIRKQSEIFEKEHHVTIQAVEGAIACRNDGPEGDEGAIFVYVENGKVTYSGKVDNPGTIGTKFIFHPEAGIGDDDPQSLSLYELRRATLAQRITDATTGLQTVRKLNESKDASIDATLKGDDDQLGATRILQLHKEYLQSLEDAGIPGSDRRKTKNQLKILNKYLALLETRRQENMKKPVRNFFRRAGANLSWGSRSKQKE